MNNINSRTTLNQAMLMRDLIDFCLESNGNVSNLEYASCFALYINEIIELNKLSDKNLDWFKLFSVLDQEYIHLNDKIPSDPKYLENIQELHDKASKLIKNR